MAELNSVRIPHAMALTGPLTAAREEAWRMAGELVGDVRIGALLIEPENGMIKLEAAHRILSFLSLTRVTKGRAIVVSEAETLNPQATNAILKIVEEPPPDTYFFFLTPEVSQLMPTLRSRLQVRRLPPGPRAWEESQVELRDQAVAFARACFAQRREGIGEFLEATKDRESAAQAAFVLQKVMRDWAADEKDYGFPDWPVGERVELWRVAHRMEGDFHGHIDRSLSLENFFYRAGGA